MKIIYIVGLPNEPKKIMNSLIALIRCGRQLLDTYHAAQTYADVHLHGGEFKWYDSKIRYPILGSGIKCSYEKKSVILDNLNKTVLFQFINSQKSMIIGGGFPTQLWLDQIPQESSDIDVYVTDEETAYKFLELIKKDVEFVDICDNNHNLVQFWWPEVSRFIQIIFIQDLEILQIIQSFDMSYCKCYIYGGRLFAMPDAVYSLRNRICVGYWRNLKISRVQKSHRYCDSIINISSTKNKIDLQKIRYFSIAIEKIKFTSFRSQYMCAAHKKKFSHNETCTKYAVYFNPLTEWRPIPTYLVRCIPYTYELSIPVSFICSSTHHTYMTSDFDFNILQRYYSKYSFDVRCRKLTMKIHGHKLVDFQRKNGEVIIQIYAEMSDIAKIDGNTLSIKSDAEWPYLGVYHF